MIDDIVIVDSEDETLAPAGRKLTSDTLAKIDEILYADIGKLQKMDKVDKVSIFVRPLFSCVVVVGPWQPCKLVIVVVVKY